VLAFCSRHRRIMWAVYGGISLLAASQFALGAWVPAHFIRNHGWSPSDVGYAYGLVFLLCGTGGVTLGGWLVGRLLQSGSRDAHLRVAMISALGSLPFAATFPLLGSPVGSVICLAAAVFFGTLAFGAGPSLLPVLCPPRMRAVVVAGYLLIANLIGQAGGPTVVALFTDYVFGSNELVRYSLVAASVLLLSSGAALIYSGMAPLRAQLADAWE
jgi:MFS family permease